MKEVLILFGFLGCLVAAICAVIYTVEGTNQVVVSHHPTGHVYKDIRIPSELEPVTFDYVVSPTGAIVTIGFSPKN